MKRFTILAISCALWGAEMSETISAQTQIQSWVDVTDAYIQNARYENNDGKGWEGTELGFDHPMQNAQHYNKNYDTYQKLTGLKSGTYRLSLQGFYRSGSASTDYEYVLNNSNVHKYAKIYAKSSVKEYTTSLPYCGSAALENSLGGKTDQVTDGNGGWWGWGWSQKYVPSNMEAAHYWFEAGYYSTSLATIQVGEDGELTIGIRKTQLLNNDWTCFTNWKLEYYDYFETLSDEPVLVNEIMPANLDLFVDPSWNYGGFAEFYNPTDKNLSLTGCYLSDNPENLKKWHIPSGATTLPAHGLGTIWFDHNDQYCKTQANFKLDIEGGTLYLSNPDGNLIVEQEYPAAVRRCSYARTEDGGDTFSWTGTATPGKTNKDCDFSAQQLETPTVSQEGKVFTGTLSIRATIPAGATLRYTTDGSVPTLTNGKTSSNGYFTVTNNTVYRFRLFKTGFLPSDVKTCSYITKERDFCAPIISIVTNDQNIYGQDYGIFVQGNGHGRAGRGQGARCNWNMDWDRPVSMEYFPDGKEVALSQEVNMCAVGGWSRAWEPHSFKLKANKEYGINYMPYAFFDEKPYNKNKTLQIRNGGNDNNCRIKDVALQAVVSTSGIDIDCQAYKPVFVYINGKLYNVLNMREPNNKHFAYANRGLNDEDMDQYEYDPDSGYVQMEGTKEKFLEWYELSKRAIDPEPYKKIKQIVDIDEFINYFAVEMYLSSDDWIANSNNVKAYRPRVEGGKFRFTLFDLDAAFNIQSSMFNEVQSKQRKQLAMLYNANGSTKTNKTVELELITIWLNMLNNAEFRKQFIDTFCLVAGSIFEPTRCKSIINDIAKNAEKVMREASGSPWNTANDVMNKLSTSRQNTQLNNLKSYTRMKLSDVAHIFTKFSTDTEGAKIYLNNIPVPTGKFNGRVYVPAVLRAEAPAGYRFTGWKDDKGNIVSESDEYEYPKSSSGTITLVASFEKITDEEMLAQGITPVRINEISASNDIYINDYFKKEDWIELYNTTDKPVDVAGMYLSDKLDNPTKFQIQKSNGISTIIPPHGFLIVWCDKNDPVSQLHASFKLGNDDDSAVILTASDESWSDTLRYDVHEGNQTYGRYPDGSNTVYRLNCLSIGKNNARSSYDTKNEDPAGIEDVTETAGKTYENDVIYDLQGRKIGEGLLPSEKGIYIQNGKKYLVR